MEPIKELFGKYAKGGTIQWIGIRPKRKVELQELNQVEVIAGMGLAKDHYKSNGGKRQVTLIQQEHLDAVASFLGKDKIDPKLTRRNIVVSGINLLSLKDQQFKIGEEVILETTGLCYPCSRMEENLGFGGYNAMRGHGGINVRVLKGGTIKKGDTINYFKTVEAPQQKA